MNHLGDANKKVSETPRMDASAYDDGAIWETGCDIERELNAANERIKRLEEAKKTIDDLKLRVKRDFETILKFKAENEWLIKKIEQLYEVAEQQKNDKLEYGRTNK